MPAPRDRRKMASSAKRIEKPEPDTAKQSEPPRFLPGNRQTSTAFYAPKNGGRVSPKQSARNVTGGGRRRGQSGFNPAKSSQQEAEKVIVAFRPHVDADSVELAKTLLEMKVEQPVLARLCQRLPARITLTRAQLGSLQRLTDLGVVMGVFAV